ncbi:nucleotide-diphospho-sugar transferase [Lojkania enalia]|uniref:Nucleotide-diphospho-sugar transferase n=1 Tax=Lojkania enalia TaxID=147567 RepID=A0A9P4K260_9PLEO|nr:nucleotide-diphospho-sugar transferase [Didymosphaeria enalia]
MCLSLPSPRVSSVASSSLGRFSRPKNYTNIPFSSHTTSFWEDLSLTLTKARPKCDPIKAKGTEGKGVMDSHTNYEAIITKNLSRPDVLILSEEDEKALYHSHRFMKQEARRLGRLLPYKPNTRGIVMTAGPEQLPILLVTVRMIRRANSKLPVEVVLASWDDYNATTCEKVLPSLNARCRVLSGVHAHRGGTRGMDNFIYKIYALILSSFQHNVFIDADCFPVRDPDELFQTAPYTTHGLITWPDMWANTVSGHFYHIASIPEVPITASLSSESGQVLVDKGKHAATLMLLAYYNYYGTDYFYYLENQSPFGRGDKDTFVPAALALDLPVYQVKHRLSPIGRHNDQFRMTGMVQYTPSDDFEAFYDIPSHLHKNKAWIPIEDNIKPFFVHHNLVKLRPLKMLDDGYPSHFNGKFQRMWGDDAKPRIEFFGRDLEKDVWESIIDEACRLDETQCKRLRKYYDFVFEGWGTGDRSETMALE